MLSGALIGLREGLEAALVVSILMAYLVKTGERASLKWAWAGVAAAVLLSLGVGAAISYGTAELSSQAQEGVGGILSLVAVVLVTGMVFWMRAIAPTIAKELRGKMEQAVRLGALAVVAVSFISVGREGIETTVFLYSTIQSAGIGSTEPVIGFLIGLAVAIAIAFGVYQGALRINLAKFFRITGVLLIVVAAGVLGYALHDLQEAYLLPGLNSLAFDLSDTLPEVSWGGALLKGFFSYSQQTTIVQAVAWVAYIVIMLPLFLRSRKQQEQPKQQASAASTSDSADTDSADTRADDDTAADTDTAEAKEQATERTR